jgi:hypothetical protein
MSFKATMRLHLSSAEAQALIERKVTPEEHAAKYIKHLLKLDLSTHPAFTIDEVFFFEDASIGSFTGGVAAIFTKRDATFIQTSTGEVLALSHNYVP